MPQGRTLTKPFGLSHSGTRTGQQNWYNLTLQQLHRKTGRMIINEYEEGGMGFEGTFECIDGNCEGYEREFQKSCEICEQKKPDNCYDEDIDDIICKQCLKEHNNEERQ